MVPPYSDQSRAIADVLYYLYDQSKQEQYLQIGIICAATSFGIAGAKDMIGTAREQSIDVLAYQQFISAQKSGGSVIYDIDPTTEISELKLSGARVIIAILEPPDWVMISNKSVEYGLIGDHYVWFCYSGCATPYSYVNVFNGQISNYTRSNMQGMIGINQYAEQGDIYNQLVQQIKTINQTEVPLHLDPSPNLEQLYHYDGIFLLAHAIQTMIEEEGFNQEGNLLNVTRFNEILRKTTFLGATGEVKLTKDGNRYSSYSIVNLQSDDMEFTKVGTWTVDEGLIIENDFQFYDQTSNIPDIDIRPPFAYWSCEDKKREVDLTGKTITIKTPDDKNPNANIEYNYHCDQFIDCENLSDESVDCSSNYVQLMIIFGSIYGFLMIISIIFLICTIIFGFIIRKKRIISASPVFLLIIVFSAMIGSTSIYAWYGKPNKVACGFQPWLLGLPIVSIIAALSSKTFRIWRIFKSPFNRKVITDFELIILWIIIMAPAVLILALWTLIATPTAHMKNIDGEEHFVCDTGGFVGPPGGYIFFGIFLFYSTIILLFGAFLSIVTRDVPGLFNESKLITISIYHLVFLSIVFIPVVIVLNEIDPYISWIIRSVGILYAFNATTWIQFIPKLIPLFFIDRLKDSVTSTKSLGQLENATNTGGGTLSNIPEADSFSSDGN